MMDITSEDCWKAWGSEGAWYEGQTCGEADCMVLGSCCMEMGDGSIECLDIVQEDCMASGGKWTGWMHCDEVSCETCPADVNGDGTVSVDDLLAVISAYNSTCSCPEDVTGDGLVNIGDLLAVLAAYGENC